MTDGRTDRQTDGQNFSSLYRVCIICSAVKILELVHTALFRTTTLPDVYHSYFVINRDVHSHDTRQRNDLHIRYVKKSFNMKSVQYSGSSSSSSSSRNECYLGGIVALLLQDHRTVSLKTVCSSQYMVTEYDQH